jgi:hypothetical protein
MWRTSTAALLAGLALAACGSSTTATTSAPSATTSTQSTDGAASSTSAAAPARCSDLRTAYLGTNGATGHLEVTFSLRNVGKRTCRIEGYPAARLLDAAGRRLPVTIHGGRGFFPDTLPAPRPVTLAPGARARFGLSFVTNNEYAGAHRCRTFVRAEVGMSGSGWVPVSLRGAPQLTPCGAKLVVSPVYT